MDVSKVGSGYTTITEAGEVRRKPRAIQPNQGEKGLRNMALG